MLRKFASALLVATIFTAPAFAEGLSKTAPTASAPTATVQPTKSDVNAVSTIKKGKHVRRHVRSHIARHGTLGKHVKHVKAVKSVKQFSRAKTAKRIHAKVHARIHAKNRMQAAVKPATKFGTN
jgi:hypothetical protein